MSQGLYRPVMQANEEEQQIIRCYVYDLFATTEESVPVKKMYAHAIYEIWPDVEGYDQLAGRDQNILRKVRQQMTKENYITSTQASRGKSRPWMCSKGRRFNELRMFLAQNPDWGVCGNPRMRSLSRTFMGSTFVTKQLKDTGKKALYIPHKGLGEKSPSPAFLEILHENGTFVWFPNERKCPDGSITYDELDIHKDHDPAEELEKFIEELDNE